jgi:hypothetical protein
MMQVTENWLHTVSGKHRDTIKRHTAHIKRDRSGRMPSDLALQALYVGDDGQLTHSEALRRLAIAREKQISQDIRLKDARVITIERHGHILLDANAKWRAALITHCLSGELLSETSVNNIIDSALELSLREMTPEEARRIKSERALSFVDRVQGHIEWLKKERARADFQTSMQCAGERLRAAYARSLEDKSPEAIAALETAQADLRKIADASPLKRFTAASNGA